MNSFNHVVLKDLLESRGVPYKSGSVSYIIKCPVCSKPKLYVRKKDGRAICFHCSDVVKGRADRVLQTVLEIPQKELAQQLFGEGFTQGTVALEIQLADHYHEFGTEELEDDELEAIPTGTIWPVDSFEATHPYSAPGIAYLASRGIPGALAEAVGIRYQPPTSRVLFPIVVDGVLRGWQGRYIKPTHGITAEGRSFTIPKAITYGKIGGKVLMFQDSLKGAEHAILTEGPMDALKCWFLGGAVASLTKSVTAAQLGIIIRSGVKRLYIGLDDDAASDVARIVRTMADSGIELYRLEPPKGYEDLGDMPLEMARAAFEAAQPVKQGQVFIYLKS